MASPYRFDRMELAGSLGDLGTLLPLALGMVLINGLHPGGLLLSIGLYYVLSGGYFKVTVPVQPMKVIGAYAVATGIGAPQILASGFLMGVMLLLIGASGAMTLIGRYTPRAVIRGVQLSTGVLLLSQGVKLMLGTSRYQVLQQVAEPYLRVQSLGPLPLGILIGVTGSLLTLLLLENRKLPAGLLVVFGGLAVGLLLGTREGLSGLHVGLHFPAILPFGFPSGADFTFAVFALVLPQIPMTLGNAVIAYVDLSQEYFGNESRKLTYRSACLSMGVANLSSFMFGGMPLCHGAGGLAAHYRFGARTAGSNVLIGVLFVVMATFLGNQAIGVVKLLPMAVLGVLLVFAGSQLALTITDLEDRKGFFVALIMLGITLASSLAYGFMAGLFLAHVLKSDKLKV